MSKEYKTFPSLCKTIKIDQQETLKKRFLEKRIFTVMNALYCQGHHQHRDYLLGDQDLGIEINRWIAENKRIKEYRICSTCLQVLKNSYKHTDRCPHAFYKTFCHCCPTKCYSLQELTYMNPIMAYSGKKILLKHPILSFLFFKNIVSSKRFIKVTLKKQQRQTDLFK